MQDVLVGLAFFLLQVIICKTINVISLLIENYHLI